MEALVKRVNFLFEREMVFKEKEEPPLMGHHSLYCCLGFVCLVVWLFHSWSYGIYELISYCWIKICCILLKENGLMDWILRCPQDFSPPILFCFLWAT